MRLSLTALSFSVRCYQHHVRMKLLSLSLAERRKEGAISMIKKLAIPAASDMERTFRTGMQIILEGAKVETGQTPKQVIWSKNKAKLYHYAPLLENRFPVPLLLVYALINRPYILDLIPGNSFVEYLVGQGFDVYLLDWGIPGDEDKYLSFDHYVLDYLPRAVKMVLRTSHAEELTLFGYCMGGTMSVMYAALFPGTPLTNLILLTTPIDFSPENLGLYRFWTDEQYFHPDRLVKALGNVPPEFISSSNRLLKPIITSVGPSLRKRNHLLQHTSIESDTWLALTQWMSDGVPFPGEAFRQWIGDFYQHNKLVKGEIKLRGRTVDLANVTCSLLSIAGTRDYICPVAQAEAIMRLSSSQDKEFLVLEAGHVDLLTSSEAQQGLWSKIRSWLEPRSA